MVLTASGGVHSPLPPPHPPQARVLSSNRKNKHNPGAGHTQSSVYRCHLVDMGSSGQQSNCPVKNIEAFAFEGVGARLKDLVQFLSCFCILNFRCLCTFDLHNKAFLTEEERRKRVRSEVGNKMHSLQEEKT